MARLRLLPSDIRDGATFWLARLWCLPAFGGPDYCPPPPARDVEVDHERGIITFRSAHDAAPFRCTTPEQLAKELDIRYEHFGKRVAEVAWSDRIYQPLARIPAGAIPVHPIVYERAKELFGE